MRSLFLHRIPLLAVVLVIQACASRQGVMTSSYRGSAVVASGPIAADDAAMKQKPGTIQKKRTASATSKSNGTETETSSTETTTVEATSAVTAPDNEVKANQ